MLATILLRTLTLLIMVDGMSNQSMDRLEPDWVSGGFVTLRDEGLRSTLHYPEADLTGDDAIAVLLSGTYGEDAPTLADLMRIRHGYNSRVMVVAQDSLTAARMGRHCADRILCAPSNDSVISTAIRLTKRYELGQGKDNDLLLLQLNALSDKTRSDILITDSDERAYYALNSQLQRILQDIPPSQTNQYIFVGVPKYGVGPDLMERVHIPMQNYDAEQIAALTNAYLMALHGPEKWVLGIERRTLRLNHAASATNDVDPLVLAQQTANFLLEFGAIRSAETTANADVRFELKIDYTPYWGAPYVTYPILTLPKREITSQANEFIHKL